MKKRLILLPLIMLCLMAGNAFAVGVKALVDRNSVVLGESLNFRIVSDMEDPRPDLSVLKDFKVVSRGASTSIRVVNFKTTREVILKYALVPLKKGALTIPPVPVELGGKTYFTQKIDISVTGYETTRDGGTQRPNRDLYVEASLSSRSPYEGEQVVYSFRLFTAVPISGANLQKPGFEGFSVREMGEGRTFSKMISGREYNVHEVKYLLTPMTAGQVTIDPAVLQTGIVKTVRRRGGFDSFFDDSFFGNREVVNRILQTEPMELAVKPLPPYTGDLTFSGVVGQVTLDAAIEETSVKSGDSTTLSVSVQGSGNIMDATLPEIKASGRVKTYSDNPEEDIKIGEEGYHGRKLFRVALVPLSPGEITIEPIRLVYFDTAREAYVTASTKTFSIQVTPSDTLEKVDRFSAVEKQEGPKPGFEKKKVEFSGRDILPLKEDADAVTGTRALSLSLFTLLMILPAAFFLGFLGLKRMSVRGDATAQVMKKRAGEALKKAGSADLGNDVFLSLLYQALVFSVYAVAGKKGESLTEREITTILSGARPNTVQDCIGALGEIEAARYGGNRFDQASREKLLKKMEKVVGELL